MGEAGTTEVKAESKADEMSGTLEKQDQEDKLMHTVMESEQDKKEQGRMLKEAMNQGLNSFMPDMMFDNMVNNYTLAKHLYGETLLNLLSSYNPNYTKRNINIPEFKKELKKKLHDSVDKLKEDGLLDKDGRITEQGVDVAAVTLYIDELDHLKAQQDFGEKQHKKRSHYGDKDGFQHFHKGSRYRDIAVRRTVKRAIKRNHKEIQPEDLQLYERASKGKIDLIYALDASGSMRGKKLDLSKKAGVALAFHAIEHKDKVGLMVFGDEVKTIIEPTDDFMLLTKQITKIRASKQTDISGTILKSIELFHNSKATKHLVVITDAMPNIGKDPEKKVIEAVSLARNAEITISLVGIQLEPKAEELAKKIVGISGGKLMLVKELEKLDTIVLHDYYSAL